MHKFLSLSFLVLIALFSQGMSCSNLKPDGGASNFRFFQNTEGFKFSQTTMGTNKQTTISLERSNPDAQALEAVARGTAEGVSKAFVPKP